MLPSTPKKQILATAKNTCNLRKSLIYLTIFLGKRTFPGSKYSLTTSSLYVLFEVILYFHAVRVFANLVHQEKAKEIMFRFVYHVDTFFIWLGITKNIE